MTDPRDLIASVIAAGERLQSAVAEFQAEVDKLQDFGQRLRSMTERLRESGGKLDDAGVMRLPRAVFPRTDQGERVEAAE